MDVPFLGFFLEIYMPVDFISLIQWLKLNDREINSFCSACFDNPVKTNTTTIKRGMDDLVELDRNFIKKNYGATTTNRIEEIRAKVKTDYMIGDFNFKHKDWYIMKPLGKHCADSFRTYFPLYLPNSHAMDKLSSYIVDLKQPCFTFDYISMTDMTNGKESILFVGAMNDAEIKCTSLTGHNWEWDVFREEGHEVYYAKCKNCGLEKEAIIGDDCDPSWNENHGWRYSKPK